VSIVQDKSKSTIEGRGGATGEIARSNAHLVPCHCALVIGAIIGAGPFRPTCCCIPTLRRLRRGPPSCRGCRLRRRRSVLHRARFDDPRLGERLTYSYATMASCWPGIIGWDLVARSGRGGAATVRDRLERIAHRVIAWFAPRIRVSGHNSPFERWRNRAPRIMHRAGGIPPGGADGAPHPRNQVIATSNASSCAEVLDRSSSA